MYNNKPEFTPSNYLPFYLIDFTKAVTQFVAGIML